MNQYKIRSYCPKCGGEGEYIHYDEDGVPIILPCESCSGYGAFIVGTTDGAEDVEWIKKKIKKILKKLDIEDDDE